MAVYAIVKFVAVCTRVALVSHRSGGSDAHLSLTGGGSGQYRYTSGSAKNRRMLSILKSL